MLTLDAIQAIAQANDLDVLANYSSTSLRGLQPPKPNALTVWFRHESVDAWVELMTQLTEVPLSIHGTRQCTGSGATDGRLYPGYAARLDEVNAERAKVGLGRVFA